MQALQKAKRERKKVSKRALHVFVGENERTVVKHRNKQEYRSEKRLTAEVCRKPQ